jgi:hypothetical protein
LIASLIPLPAVLTYGQQTGEVTGTVTDVSGALVAGANVTATNTAMQQVRTATSNDTGTYTFPYLQSGNYDLRAEKAGFKVITNPGVSVQLGDVARINFGMEVGTVSQNVVVTTREPAAYYRIGFARDGRRFADRPNWNVPGSSDARSSATFGVVTTAGTMRQMQFALKYSF